MKKKQIMSMALAAVTAFGLLSVTGCGDQGTDSADTFSWWIYKTDGNGLYENYDDNPSVQWLNQQTWDVENHTISKDGSGEELNFTFTAPIAGSENDNFNTMMSTGDYTDIIDLCVSTDNAEALYEEGITLDLTEYIETYCPNYVEFLDANPEVKSLLTTTDENGDVHYYSIASIKDGVDVPWDGYVYRRDWVVKYCDPTEYVWDWDSAYVQQNGHPAVTPLEKAIAQNNLEGWKVNEVKEFQVTNDGGDDPNNNYEDNVIFPSGTNEPLTISDWEWMFEGFNEAIEARGWADDTDAYATTLVYQGYMATGDLVSSFGGGNGTWAKDANDDVYYAGTTENFRTYLEAMNTWYENGWLDTAFMERGGDLFFSINETGFTTGKVGMQMAYTSALGDGIRATCLNEEDARDAYIMGCKLPINDVYGGADQMYKEPDALYQGGKISGQVVLTKQAEEKNLPALFTYFNWLFTDEGAVTKKLGLSSEQLASVEIEDNLYEENDLDGGYVLEQDENGNPKYVMNYDVSADINGSLTMARMQVGIDMTGVGQNLNYTWDKGESKVLADALEDWGAYTATANLSDYDSQFSSDDNQAKADVQTQLGDYINQTIPKLITEGLDGWDEYVEKVTAYGVEDVCEIYQKYLNK